jgi:hypothetical protein
VKNIKANSSIDSLTEVFYQKLRVSFNRNIIWLVITKNEIVDKCHESIGDLLFNKFVLLKD